MKSKYNFLWCVLLLVGGLTVKAQSFRNLGFEEANTNSTTFIEAFDFTGKRVVYGLGPTEDLIPGWQLFKGSDLVLTIGINSGSVLAGASVNLNTPSFSEGNYGLEFGFNAEGEPWSLVQRGDVPPDAAYLAFRTSGFDPFGSRLQPMLNGEVLTIAFADSSGLQLFDASSFAGEKAELRFILDNNTGQRLLDDIQFMVPEPSPQSIILIAVVSLISWHSMKHIRNGRAQRDSSLK